jgi:hypothetical protein
MLTTIVIVVLMLALIGVMPRWGYSREWGYGPGGSIAVILIIIVVLAMANKI